MMRLNENQSTSYYIVLAGFAVVVCEKAAGRKAPRSRGLNIYQTSSRSQYQILRGHHVLPGGGTLVKLNLPAQPLS